DGCGVRGLAPLHAHQSRGRPPLRLDRPADSAPVISLARIRRNGLGIIGLVLAGGAILAPLAAPLLAPHDSLSADFAQSLQPPGTPGHPWGTDQLGRGLLSRVIYGARIALFIGLC